MKYPLISTPRITNALRARLTGLFSLLVVIGLVLLTTWLADPLFRPYATFISKTGNVVFIATGLALLSVGPMMRGEWQTVRGILIAALIITVLIHGMKLTIGHWLPRPSGKPGGFPSGHAASGFALAFLLSRRYPRMVTVWYGAAILIAWSRVGMHSHYLYQVIAGTIIGIEIGIRLYRSPLLTAAMTKA